MGGRDRWTSTLTCPKCNKKGEVQWSEWEIPSMYSGSGRTLDGLSEGFIEGTGDDSAGFKKILCSDCLVEARH